MNPENNKQITLDDFNSFESKDDLINKWLEYFQTIGLAIDDIENWKKFIEKNSYTLYLEAKQYGLNKTNPFFIFLNQFVLVNKQIYILIPLYSTLHNLVAYGSITEKQLAFTCPENEQIRILVNKSLYQNNSNDFKYLVRCYDWLLSLDINRDIKNKYIVNFFANNTNLDDNLILIRDIFFSDDITEFMNSNKNKDDENKLKQSMFKTENNDSLIRNPLVSCDTIEQNIKWLNENIQESSRSVTGQYQKKDVDKDIDQSKNNNNVYMSPNEIRVFKDKINPILNSLAQKANIGNGKAADIIKLIKQLY